MAVSEVRAIHEKAVERASEDDAAWFRDHLNRRFRLRDVIPYEFNQKLESPPVGNTWRTLVALVQEGVRMRQPIYLPKEAPNEGATDVHLKAIFDQVAIPKAREIMAKAGA